MLALIVYERDDHGTVTVPLKGDEIRIGRVANDNDIVLDYDKKVSASHGRIFIEGGRYYLEDLKSSNGTFVNGEKIYARHQLKDNDGITVGDVVFTFCLADPSIPEEKFSHTYFNAMPRSLKKQPLTRYSLTSNQVIGRDPESDIVLEHPLVSCKHAILKHSIARAETVDADSAVESYDSSKRMTGSIGIEIIDTNSTNGTYLNGKRVKGTAKLRANDIIQIGPYKLMFDGLSLAQINEQGNIRLDVTSLSVIRDKKKKILNEVSLSVRPQDFVAIVGSSGAGKSTLLRALCGAAFAEEGVVLINGMNFYDNFDSFRSMLGYVPQDDIIHRQLTVQAALGYAAELRLPSDMRKEEINIIIDDILAKLAMQEHAHKVVSSLSGGQRKRVSIAVEMLTNPSLFFLDEPTSGLDPATEQTLMELMRDRAKIDGKTVLLVTHVTKNVNLCDRIIVMGAGGYLTFYGTPDEALDFFKVEEFTRIYNRIDTPAKATARSAEFLSCDYYRDNIEQPLSEMQLASQKKRLPGEIKHGINLKRNKTSQLKQFWTLTRRYLDIKTKDKKNLIQTTAMLLGICVLLRIIFGDDILNVGSDENNFGNAIKLVFFLCCLALWFGTSGSSLEIIGELPVYLRESMINLRIVPYIMSKLVVLSIIAAVQTALIMVVLLSFEAVRQNPALSFWLAGGIFVTFFTSICLGLALSALVRNPGGASSWLPIILVIQIIFSGAIVPLNAMDKEKAPLRYFSLTMPSRWSFTMLGEILKVDEMLYNALEDGAPEKKIMFGTIYGDFKGSFLSIEYPVNEGNESLKNFGKDAYEALFAMFMLSVIFILICYFALQQKEVKREEFMK